VRDQVHAPDAPLSDGGKIVSELPTHAQVPADLISDYADTEHVHCDLDHELGNWRSAHPRGDYR
jgi:hypothetical protein